MMTGTKPKSSADERSFTSWKLNIINAASADPRVAPTHFRLLVRVVATLNEHTRVAVLSDEALADEVPGFAVQSTCYRARKHLTELGWIEFEPGKGFKATRYRVLDQNVKPIEAKRDIDRKAREAERQDRIGFAERRPNPAPMQDSDQSQPCISLPSSTAPVQVVHPQGTPSEASLPVQDVSQEAPDPGFGPCSWCGKPSLMRDIFDHAYCVEHVWVATGVSTG